MALATRLMGFLGAAVVAVSVAVTFEASKAQTADAVSLPTTPFVELPSTTTTTTAPSTTLLPEVTVAPTTTSTVAPTTVAPAPPPVQTAQEQLTGLGYWLGKPDGKAGATTQQAVWAFQKVQHLPKTGKLDAATLAALQSALRPVAPTAMANGILIDKTQQVIFVLKDSEVAYVFNTSTGTERSYTSGGHTGFADTPVGDFEVFREVNKSDPGPLGNLYRPKYFTTTGIAVHGAAAIPPYAASHGCARVSNAAMDFIWANDIMPIGVSVSIVGVTPAR